MINVLSHFQWDYKIFIIRHTTFNIPKQPFATIRSQLLLDIENKRCQGYYYMITLWKKKTHGGRMYLLEIIYIFADQRTLSHETNFKSHLKSYFTRWKHASHCVLRQANVDWTWTSKCTQPFQTLSHLGSKERVCLISTVKWVRLSLYCIPLSPFKLTGRLEVLTPCGHSGQGMIL